MENNRMDAKRQQAEAAQSVKDLVRRLNSEIARATLLGAHVSASVQISDVPGLGSKRCAQVLVGVVEDVV